MKTTFQSHGLTWTRHTPGDPRPCDRVALVEVLLRCDEGRDVIDLFPEPASSFDWGVSPSGDLDVEIIGWRYVGSETPPSTSRLVQLFDTTWVDPTQVESVSLSAHDYLEIQTKAGYIHTSSDAFDTPEEAKAELARVVNLINNHRP